MRVAIDGMLLRSPFSGVEHAIGRLAQALAEHGREEYRFYIPGRSPLADVTGPRFLTRRSRLSTQYRPLRILWEQFLLPGELRRRGVDVLHAPGYIAPLRARVPVVLTVYDLIALRFPGWCRPSNALHFRLMLPRSVRRAALVIVPSAATRDDLVTMLGAPASKLRVVPLGVNRCFRVLADRGQARRVCERHGVRGPFVLYVGACEPKKNTDRLLDAFARLKARGVPGHEHLIVGSRGWRRGAAPRRAHELGIAAAVRTLGAVPEEDLVCLYNCADLFVFPSLYEGFGLPPLEAMACGAPVICSDAGALPEVTGDAATHVDPHDVAGLAAAMRATLGSDARRAAMIEKGLHRAGVFSWRRHAEAAEDIYREACSSKDGR